jgi:hypothetical protein
MAQFQAPLSMPALPPPTRFPSPPLTDRFVVRIDADHGEAIRTLAKRHKTPETTVLRAAVERGLHLLWDGSEASDQGRTG